jgi:hypothetical protein
MALLAWLAVTVLAAVAAIMTAFLVATVCDAGLRVTAYLYSGREDVRKIMIESWRGELAVMKIRERPGYVGDLLSKSLVRWLLGRPHAWALRPVAPLAASDEPWPFTACVVEGLIALGAIVAAGVAAFSRGEGPEFFGMLGGTLFVIFLLLTILRAWDVYVAHVKEEERDEDVRGVP